MKPEEKFARKKSNLVPSLLEVAEAKRLNLEKLAVAVVLTEDNRWHCPDRNVVPVSDTKEVVHWRAASLRELFRGDQPAPPNIERYPEEYVPLFYFVEAQIVTFCQALGDKSDQEFEEVFANLRRRPDGRSLGPLHDFVWQLAALLLGTWVVSAAEFEAVFGQLARSAQRWSMRPVSRNYIAYVRGTLEGK